MLQSFLCLLNYILGQSYLVELACVPTKAAEFEGRYVKVLPYMYLMRCPIDISLLCFVAYFYKLLVIYTQYFILTDRTVVLNLFFQNFYRLIKSQ